MKKSALKERIKVLEEDLTQLQTQFDSEKTMLISKDEHKKFIDQLHSIHNQESSRLKEISSKLTSEVQL